MRSIRIQAWIGVVAASGLLACCALVGAQDVPVGVNRPHELVVSGAAGSSLDGVYRLEPDELTEAGLSFIVVAHPGGFGTVDLRAGQYHDGELVFQLSSVGGEADGFLELISNPWPADWVVGEASGGFAGGSFEVAAIPEPVSAGVALVGASLLLLRRRVW